MVGCLLLPLFHAPKLLFQLLLVSYAYVFNRHDTLTANPIDHLSRARKLLQGQPSQILYAALEVRFALERMANRELLFTEKVSNRVRDDNNPVKKIKALRRADQETAYAHNIYLIDQDTGTRISWGQYKPLDQQKTVYFQGRLGNLLHPKEGLKLGVWNDFWYSENRAFLIEAIDYLSGVAKDNTPFFAFENIDHIEVIRDDVDSG